MNTYFDGIKTCYVCNSTHEIHRHHIDWIHDNSNANNIIGLCQRCHTALHKNGVLSFEELTSVREAVKARDPSRFEKNAKPKNAIDKDGQHSLF